MRAKIAKAITVAAAISMAAAIPVFAAGRMNGSMSDPRTQTQGMPFRQGSAGQTGDVQAQQGFAGQMGGMQAQQGFEGQMGGMQNNVTYETEPLEIVTSDVVNTASDLTVKEADAEKITMSDKNNDVEITESGTYLITGTCSDGNITVKKGVTGVVLILKDLDLTSTSGAAVSCNKGSEVKIVIRGSVTLTDAEDPADEDSTDTETADAFDGAAIKIKDGANVCLTGDGTLTIEAGNCKNGIKIGDADVPSFVIDGEDLTLNITAANDAINGGYDVTILSGTINITAGDDAIHADRILTIGSEDESGPVINISKCSEGLEATVINLFGGEGTVVSSDDAVNAADSERTYAAEMTYSINVTGGTWVIRSSGDGLDSNGNVNITGGSVTITSAVSAGEAGIDYDGSCYIADGTVTNNSGVSGPDMMGGMAGGMKGGAVSGMTGGTSGSAAGTVPGGMNGGTSGSTAGTVPGGMNGGFRR